MENQNQNLPCRLFYSFAGITIAFFSEFPLKENGFAPLFRVPEQKSDFTVILRECSAYSTGRELSRSELARVLETPEGIRLRQCIDIDSGAVCFEERREGNTLFCSMTAQDAAALADLYYLWRCIDLGSLLLQSGRLLLHCSYIVKNGKAVLFCGPSGIGKSTQASLWESVHRAQTVNGDKAIVYMKNGRAAVSSVPIAGTSGICKNAEAPLAAIVLLSQGDANRAAMAEKLTALRSLLTNTVIDFAKEGATEQALALAAQIYLGTRILTYSCLPEASAAVTLFDYLEELHD